MATLPTYLLSPPLSCALRTKVLQRYRPHSNLLRETPDWWQLAVTWEAQVGTWHLLADRDASLSPCVGGQVCSGWGVCRDGSGMSEPWWIAGKLISARVAFLWCQFWTPWGQAEGTMRQKPAFWSPWKESVCRKRESGELMCTATY